MPQGNLQPQMFINKFGQGEKMKDKFILDACCGPRMMWFDKHHPNTLYIDNREGEYQLSEGWGKVRVSPDNLMDFRKMEFADKSFKLVVFDPPHLKRCGPNSCLGKKFGVLNGKTWKADLQQGLSECWRVLEDYGVLLFKWNDHDIKRKEIMQLFPASPLFFNITSGVKVKKGSQTLWFCFMKLKKETI